MNVGAARLVVGAGRVARKRVTGGGAMSGGEFQGWPMKSTVRVADLAVGLPGVGLKDACALPQAPRAVARSHRTGPRSHLG